jgi:hypothetical protein
VPAAFANGFRAGGHAEVRVVVVVVESVLAEGELVQLRQGLVTVEAEPFEVLPRHARQATAVREEVADRDRLRHGGIRQREGWQVFGDRVRPGHDLVGDELGDAGAGDRLRDRRDLEHSVGVDDLRLAHVADAEPLAYMIFPPWTTAMAIPGVPLRFITASPISSTSAIADRIWP